MKRSRTISFSGLIFLASVCFFSWAQPTEEFRSVVVELFYEKGCSDCQTVRNEVLPELKARFEGLYVLKKHDLEHDENFRKLLRYQNELGSWANEPVSIVVEQRIMLCGVSTIRTELLCCVEKCITEKLSVFPDSSELDIVEPDDEEILQTRFENFALPAVIVAGLLDGLNPCAISTLVFFMSLLAVSTRLRQGCGGQEVRKSRLLVLGASYCLASFLTYLTLGFGLLRVLHLFSGFTVFRSTVEWGMVAVLLSLAFLSFRDALRFRKSHDSHDVALQLSTGMKKRIHSVMRRGLGVGSVILGGLLIGTAVTALESVCTGQVYVPTLVLILKNNALAESRAWLYLLVYNLMFILPLVLTFIAVYFGLRTETLLRWSRENVVFTKALLGFFFVSMALLIRLI